MTPCCKRMKRVKSDRLIVAWYCHRHGLRHQAKLTESWTPLNWRLYAAYVQSGGSAVEALKAASGLGISLRVRLNTLNRMRNYQ